MEFQSTARSDLRKLDRRVQKRLIDFLTQRVIGGGDPRRFGKALHGDQGEFWRYRLGEYCIICLIEHRRLVVVVISIGHRREVYR